MRFTHPLSATILVATCMAVSGCGQQPTPETDTAASPFPENARVTGTLSCERFQEWDSFDKSVPLVIDGVRITTQDLGVEPGREQFETWSGQIQGDRVTLTGRYKQYGQKSARPVNLTGEYADGQIRLQGTRGPRDCTYVSTQIDPQN